MIIHVAMAKSLIIIPALTFVLCSLGCDARPDHIWVGMDWVSARQKLIKAGWIDMGVNMANEHGDGMVYSYQSPCGSVLFFCTTNANRNEYLSEMNPSDSKIAGKQLIITEVKYR